VATAVRFLDGVVDVSAFPLPAQRAEAKAKRRIGLGVTGLADALIMLGVRYGEPQSLALAERWLAAIKRAGYAASARLAAEKGAFPRCDAQRLLARPGAAALPEATRALIAQHGLRNGLLTSIAPTGTISLLAGNVSSGIEPVFEAAYDRRILEPDGRSRIERVEDHACALHRRIAGTLPPALVTAGGLAPRAHLEMQAAAQRHIDSSISKTINCPIELPFERFKDIYLDAFDLGLKGVTTYRPNPVTGAVLAAADAATVAPSTNGVRGTPTAPPILRSGEVDAHASGSIVYMSQPLARDVALAGFTYKLRWPGSDHAMYITINDIEIDGRRRPFEIFINSKNLEHYAWTLALTRMISAVFRRGGDISFVVEELKAVFDPQGGRWMSGRYVPSLLAAIGEVIEAHLMRIGALTEPVGLTLAEMSATPGLGRAAEAGRRKPSDMLAAGPLDDTAAGRRPAAAGRAGDSAAAGATASPERACPRCGIRSYVKIDGCWVCRTCGHSNCA
jgi:ribonucleoside-diphosphate reductase alpha chain